MSAGDQPLALSPFLHLNICPMRLIFIIRGLGCGLSSDKNQIKPLAFARASPIVSSPSPYCSEASFGKPATEKKQPSCLRLATARKTCKTADAAKYNHAIMLSLWPSLQVIHVSNMLIINVLHLSTVEAGFIPALPASGKN